MDEQLLKDLVATAEADNYDWDVIMPKFPELSNYDLQLLKDYVATAEADSYNYETINAKFPEFKEVETEVEEVALEDQKEDVVESKEVEEVKLDEDLFEERELFTQKDFARQSEEEDNYIKDALTGFAQQSVDLFGVGPKDFEKMLKMQALEIGLNMHDSDLSREQKRSLLIAGEKAFDITDTSKEMLEDVSESLAEKQIKYETESFLDDLENGDYAQASKRAVSSAFKSLPTLIAAYTGVGGIVGIGIGSAGNKFDEEFKRNPDKTIAQLGLNAIAVGATEATFELVTRGMLKQLGFIKSTKGLDAAKKFATSSAMRLFNNFGIQPGKEGLSEAATRFATDALDSLTLGKEFNFKRTLKGAAEEGILGFITGTGAGTVSSIRSNNKMEQEAAAIMLMPTKDKSNIGSLINLINESTKELKNASEVEKKLLNERISNAELKISKIKQSNFNNLKNMTDSELQEYSINMDIINENIDGLNSEKDQVVKQAEENIKLAEESNNKLIESSSKKDLDRKVNFLKDQGNLVLKASDQKRIDKAIREIESETGLEVDKSQIETNPENFKIEVINEANADRIIEEYGKNEKGEYLFSKKDLLEESEGTYLAEQGVILMNEQAALGVIEHEGVHNYFDMALNKLGNEKAVFRMAEVLMDEMEKIDEAAANKVKQFRELYEKDSRYKARDIAEEVLTFYAQIKKQGRFTKRDTTSRKLSNSIRRLFQNTFNLSKIELNEDNVMNFIDDYLVAIEKGELTRFQKRFAKGEVEISESLKEKGKKIASKKEKTIKDSQIPVEKETFTIDRDGQTNTVEVITNKDGSRVFTEIQDGQPLNVSRVGKDNTLTNKEYVEGVYEDIVGESTVVKGTENINPKIAEKLKSTKETGKSSKKIENNKTIKEIFDKFTGPAENRKFKSKEEFKNSPEFFDALLEIEQSNTLDASIRNTVSEAYLDMNPGFVREVKEKISDKYRSEYDASKNSLFGWLTGKNISGQPLINLVSGDIQIKRGKKPSTVTTTKKVGGEDSKVTVAETLVSDEISPEDYTDMKLAQDKLKKNKPQQSAIANKIGLTENELNLAKREIINFLRKTDRPAMTDPKKFFKALVDYTTGKGVQPGGFANVIYDKLSLPKNGELSTKNRESFIKKIAEDLIALNKVDPSVMRRSKWTPFYKLEIKNMNPTQMQKAIDEGRIPSTSNLKSGLDLFKTLDPSVDQVTEYLMNIRPDVLKRKIPKFLAEVIVKNEFNDIVNNTTQPIYDTKGNVTDNTIDLSETVTEQEVKRGAPQVREKIARPEGVKFSKTKDFRDITKGLSDVQIAQEISAVNKIAEDLGVSTEDVLSNIKDNISKYNKLRKELKIKEGGAKNISSKDNYLDLSQTYKSFIKNSIPKGKTFDDLPMPVQQAIIDTVGFGDTRITIGGTPLTFKAMTKSVKGYSNLLKTVFGEDVLIGTGKTIKNIDAIFAPRNWGMFRKQVEKIVLQEGITPEQAKIKVEDLLRSKSKSETSENYTIDETLAANRNLLNAGYSSLIDLIVENKNEKTLGLVTDLLEAQVNRATGIFKGMVPMTSFNMKPEKGNTKNQNKLMHNEHLLELFNANKDFLKLANSFIEGKISEQDFRSKTIKNVNKLQQAVISERMRAQKDASGASVRDFVDPLTFLGKDAVNQIPIGSLKLESGDDFTGLNMAQFIVENLSNVQIQKLAKTVRGSLSAEGIMVKSIVDNYKDYLKLKKSNIDNLSNNVVKFSKTDTNQDIIGYAKTVDEALAIARDPDAPVKKIRVFDFDDTLAQTKSIVFYTKPDGTEGQLTAEEFAEKGADLVAEGAVMDFSDFNIVRDGKRGPLFDIAKKIEKARGTEDVFVLTARAPESQQAIHEFLKSEGLNIPIENITGLGNSTGAAKANWIVDKAADGYNDFYFADDAYQNVKAVQDALSQLDVKSKVQQAKVKFSKTVNEDFNKIIEQTTGIASEKTYSKAKAKVRGAGKGNKKFFIPYSAEDFMGLIYPLLSKGMLGDSQMAWFKQNLLDPYARAVENLSTDRLQLMQDFKALKKALEVPKNLRKQNDTGFTNEQAVRVYLFNKMGYDVPGLSKTDLQDLIDVVNSDGLLKAFSDQLMNLTKGDGYAKPGQSWLAGTITTDLIDVLNTVKRKKYLEQSGFLENAELIFSEENLNKLEAAYGEKYRESMENILKRMKSGKNRLFSGNRLSNRVLDYVNGSIGTIMFLNARSAVLQTISSINFINWSFNNPIKAGKAFANQKQYWKDFMDLMNSDYLMDRRNGLKLNISESEIADAASTSKNKAKAAINYILQKGFAPTQIADSFAIASGGATFYRNRINDLIKNEGLTEAEAKEKAMLEFRQISETSQQSSDPSKISAQQSSDLGRIILAFANTPMQYARIQKRAAQDLINGRGDAKSHVSKIIYYGVVQNIIFNALQQSLFALGFGDDEDEMTAKELEAHEKDKNKRYYKIANGMLDSQLRGLGVAGATTSVIKNFLLDIYERSDRKRPEYVDAVYKLLQISPPISSKISKVRQAAYQFDSKKRREEIFEKGFSLDNPAYEAGAKVLSATTNIPLDRVYNKVNNIEAALAEDTEAWQTVAMLAGWPEWQIKPKDKKKEVSKFDKGNVKVEKIEDPKPVVIPKYKKAKKVKKFSMK